jgi:hypothetical protein
VHQEVEPSEKQTSASSSNPDAPGATPAHARLRAHRGSEIGWKIGAPIGADSSLCWPYDKAELNNNAGAGRSDNRDGRRCCNIGTCVDLIGNSSSPESEEKSGRIKEENRIGRTSKTKKEEELSM